MNEAHLLKYGSLTLQESTHHLPTLISLTIIESHNILQILRPNHNNVIRNNFFTKNDLK